MLVPDKLDERDTRLGRHGEYATTLNVFFLAEMGDKTQIATVALAAQYLDFMFGVAGTTRGMMSANVPAVLVGERIAARMPVRLVHGSAAAIFVLLGVATLPGAGARPGPRRRPRGTVSRGRELRQGRFGLLDTVILALLRHRPLEVAPRRLVITLLVIDHPQVIVQQRRIGRLARGLLQHRHRGRHVAAAVIGPPQGVEIGGIAALLETLAERAVALEVLLVLAVVREQLRQIVGDHL